jgi:putative ABC transport system permease protein
MSSCRCSTLPFRLPSGIGARRLGSLLLAVAFAGAVGVFFGFYPARQAARLDPIVALRYE